MSTSAKSANKLNTSSLGRFLGGPWNTVVILVSIQDISELVSNDLLHQLDIALPVTHIDGLQCSPVVHGVHLAHQCRC